MSTLQGETHERERGIGARRRRVFVSGNFNIVHPGHLRLLKFAAECGDYLIVGVQDDTHLEAIVPAAMRCEGVQAISCVDDAFVLDEPVEQWIARHRPEIVVKGKEYENRENPERAIVESYGGTLLFGSGETRFSSIDLIARETQAMRLCFNHAAEFGTRHGFSLGSLRRILRAFRELRVVVVGDLIVDEYVMCEALGMSQEDPTIVVSPVHSERFVGGAGIVAAHAHGLGAQVEFFSVAGDDATRTFALDMLIGLGVRAQVLTDTSRPTTLKTRYRAQAKTLLRVSALRQHAISQELAAQLLQCMEPALSGADLLIFSDFSYGCLPQSLVDAISERCRELGVAMVADSQSSSQVGDITRFRDMLLITPTEREARLALRDFTSGLIVLADALHHRARARHVVITLGAEGLIAHRPDMGMVHEWVTDRLPALNPASLDVAGAGDSLLCCAAMALVSGATLWQSAYLGSLAAACQVARVGNVPLSTTDIEAQLDEHESW
ncbi:PfkB family carbohydrate kinase [Burkholderia diffusa]|uniref:PfkB family carbohydrate kinase n=1 Tax=Burkholderia diffusa TaxID=488732 RepID=UPI0007534209|nr:PfkB family carbohydrate kinase [Burkholderia diffusa]KVN06960.1 ADP-heptose synthase [Burkholderia diffusa]